MLSPWSLRHKRLKKRVALALIWRRSLRRVDLFHALNEIERQDLERELPAAPVAVVPNGVNLEEFASPPDHVPSLLDPLTGGRPFVLFLARLHYVKGPDRLLEAFALALLSGLLPGADLIMAGPDFGMLERLRAQARALGLGARVRFIGNIGGAAKLNLLRQALCLCQPSRYEGFSITLLESLACGVPVVITPESNFPEVALHGAGLVVEGTAEKLSGALVNIIRDPEMRVAMGRAGVELVRREFTWGAVAERSLLAYERLRAGKGAALTQRALA
jgi:glycosyltransferase involved in cell wall biosynthesis